MTPRLVLCLMACAFHWLPLSLADRIAGRVLYLGWLGSVAYSLLVVVLCLIVLLPAADERR